MLPDYDAILMHAAVIDNDGQGAAFAAKSGTGKTTRVNLWKTVFGGPVKNRQRRQTYPQVFEWRALRFWNSLDGQGKIGRYEFHRRKLALRI